jgi:2,3-bisphosphoglycerate-independent phosphoglycerate mutase
MNDDGSPNTQHSLNPVPCILIDENNKNIELKDGILADVAPTICKIMGLEKPKEMTGKELF